MFRKMFSVCILMQIIAFEISVSESKLAKHQKLILALSEDLFIKNIVLINTPSLIINEKIIVFAKILSRSNIYFSLLSSKEIQLKINDYMNFRSIFLKSIIVAFEEKSNKEMYEVISDNDLGASKFMWLVWDDENRIREKSGVIYIPYDCQLLVADESVGENNNISYISEMYHPRVNTSNMLKRHFGTWTENKGLEIPERDIYKRRFDMNGTQLGILIAKGVPIDSQWNYDFIKIILKAMNIRLLGIIVDEHKQGDESRPWEIDPYLTIFHHLMPYEYRVLGLTWKQSAYLYIPNNQIIERHAPFTRPFATKLWQAVLISIAFTGFSTFLLNYIKRKIVKSHTFNFLSAFYHPLDAFTNQSGTSNRDEKSIRITIMTARFIALFIVPAYSAFLLTYILYPNMKLPFTDINGLAKDGSYKIAFPKEQNWGPLFEVTTDSSSELTYKQYLLEPDKMPHTFEEMEDKIYHETDKIAFLLTDIDALFIQCKIVKIPTPLITGWLGFLLRKKSPYKSVFNRIFKNFHSAGILDKYDKQLHLDQFLYKKFDNTNNLNAVKIQIIIPAIQKTSRFYILSVIILFFECLYKHRKSFINRLRPSNIVRRISNRRKLFFVKTQVKIRKNSHFELDLNPKTPKTA